MLDATAAACGAVPGRPESLPRDGENGAVCVMASVDDERLCGLMRRPFAAYLEAAEAGDDHPVVGPSFAATVAANGLYLWITTGTAFELGTTMHFCDGLEARGAIGGDRRHGVELALHEAVANALLHGNLGLDSEMRDDFRRYADFCRLLDERLHDPVARRGRVEIAATWGAGTLDVAVRDQGIGYPAAAVPPAEPQATGDGLAIHGLGIIHSLSSSVTTDDNGRCLIMRFSA